MGQLILIVEDEKAIADTLAYPLETEGFKTKWASTCLEARKFLQEHEAHLIVLDVGLPDGSGFDFCREIRQSSDVPIIFLTARKEELDKVVGLEIGADDYLTKPFSPRELSSRVRAILRWTSKIKTEPLKVPFEVNEAGNQVRYFGELLELSRFEYLILKVLLSRPGWIFSREQLLEKAWDEPGSILDRTIDAHMKSIRKKLKAVNTDKEAIVTHRGLGYALGNDW